MARVIPVVLFAYARPEHLRQVLDCLRAEGVPQIHVYADGARGSADQGRVDETRALLRSVDWCEMEITERETNLGLGRNVLDGISRIAKSFDAFVVWEDDLVCLPGTYRWICAALEHYEKETGVMSVTAWTHPKVALAGIDKTPYFDGRAECWVWGSWARCWQGMVDQTAEQKLRKVENMGLPADAYGADLPAMARVEAEKNIWAVRWLYHHLQHQGICLRPPRPFVRHIGFDAGATNADDASIWENHPIEGIAELPLMWPAPVENPGCRALWQASFPRPPWWRRVKTYAGRLVAGKK